MLDANANRAREAVRVLEDVARFALDHQRLSAALRALRHDLDAAVRAVVPDALLMAANRDTPGDVGAAAAGATRANLRDVADANGARAGEALRVCEECAALLGEGAPPGAFDALRYRAYDAHRALVLALGSPARRQFRVCVLLTAELCTHHAWERVAELALDAGTDCLQLREKTLPDREFLARARTLVRMCRGRAAVFVNDRPDIALLAGADGVHVGQADLPIADVRRLCGASLLIGVSTGSLPEAIAAAEAGADLCGVGSMYHTTTKQKPVVAGVAYLREYLACPRTGCVPHFAIGGVTPGRAGELARAGCRGVAVSRAVCSAPDPGAAVAAILRALNDCPPPAGAPGFTEERACR